MHAVSPLAVTSFYLASQSPRRRELLRQIGVSFRTVTPAVDESPRAGEGPAAFVQRLAAEKASAGLALAEAPDATVLGADTIVVVDERILGKPAGRQEAVDMLRLLSGRCHQVLSAVNLASRERRAGALAVTEVSFRPLNDEEIEAYWATGEPRDKAGAYGIQGLGAVFVHRIAGSYSAVVGLPIETLVPLLREFAIPYWQPPAHTEKPNG